MTNQMQAHELMPDPQKELGNCYRIYEQRIGKLGNLRGQRDGIEVLIQETLAAIQHVKRRIYELESIKK